MSPDVTVSNLLMFSSILSSVNVVSKSFLISKLQVVLLVILVIWMLVTVITEPIDIDCIW